MNKIMFEMQSMVGTFQFYANIDKDNIVEYEIEEDISETGSISTKGKLDIDKSKLFIDFIEKADIKNINELVENEDQTYVYTDTGTYSISSFKYGNAFWNGYEELENMHYIYLAISLCDESMVDMLLGYRDDLSSNIKDIIKNLGLKISQDDEE